MIDKAAAEGVRYPYFLRREQGDESRFGTQYLARPVSSLNLGVRLGRRLDLEAAIPTHFQHLH
jgi:hypothetical protein